MISSPDTPHSPDANPHAIADSEAGPRSEEPREKMSPQFKEFSEKAGQLPTPEERIAYGLQFMRSAISQEGSPRFREFWEARRLVLPFFKESLNPAVRPRLWGEYVELTVEARRLKEILEEQSAFAVEQIELAVQALEKEMGNFEAAVLQAEGVSFPESSPALRQKASVYSEIQRQLNVLNAFASRLNGLRKEVIKTEMRIRFKTKLFKRLSELGDQIFPKRKQLIEAVSSEFEKDIDEFAAKHFRGEEVVGAPYYALREEIKALQGAAKSLTLSSGVFTRTRLKLSECWDKVKVLEKEHKKEALEKKQASSEQKTAVSAKIEALKEKAAGMSLRDLDREIDQIQGEMRAIPLHRDDVRALREEIAQLRAPFLQAQEQKTKELEAAEKEKFRLRKEKVSALKGSVSHLIKEGEKMELDGLSAAYQELLSELEQLEISKIEKQQIERTMRPLKDLIADKKEHSLVNLSEDDKKTLENLRLVLQQRKQRRQEIKEQLESYRRTLGSSGLDFEKAMHYRELADQEKERLEKANAGIEEIEQKIAELEG